MARRPKLNPSRKLSVDPSLKDIRRFLASVEETKNGGGSGCWLWLGFKDDNGYGQFKYRGVAIGAHRFAHAVFNGPVQARLHVHHDDVCKSHACVRPSHIRTESWSENSRNRNGRRGTSGKKVNRVKVQETYMVDMREDGPPF